MRLQIVSIILAVGLFGMGDIVYSAPRVQTKKLVFSIDGFSYEAFTHLREQGYFKQFNHFGAHLAPFPSLTDPSWTEITRAKEFFGERKANVQTVEAKYFDLEAGRVCDDPRNVYSRMANPSSFMRAFDYYFNPFLEALMYFPGDAVIDSELKEMESAILSGFTGEHYIAFMGSSDAIGHTQKDRLLPLLKKISALVDRVEAHFAAKGILLEMWMIADHGNAGSFSEGETEVPLAIANFDENVKRAGLEWAPDKLVSANQIAMPVMALAGMAGIYFKDLSKREIFARELSNNPAVEVVSWLEVPERGQKFMAVMGRGETSARLYWKGSQIAYQPILGNPLGVDERLHSKSSELEWVSEQEFLNLSGNSHLPDAAFRLVQVGKKQVANEPDLLVSIADGYRTDGPLGKFVTMYRTHGSLSARNTRGILASNQVDVPPFVRSRDVMKVIGLSPDQIFHKVREERQHKGSLPTQVGDLSTDIIYRRLVKILDTTRGFVSSDDIRDIQDWLRILTERNSSKKDDASDPLLTSLKGINFRELLNQIDDFAQLKSAIEGEKDPEKIKTTLIDRLEKIKGLEPLMGAVKTSTAPTAIDSNLLTRAIDAIRRVVMKLYTFPFLINEWLTVPEMEKVRDSRDTAFFSAWSESGRRKALANPEEYVSHPEKAQELWRAVWTERMLAREIAPIALDLQYDRDFKDITVVFIPGIYNELFDTEIFSRGLRAISEKMGLRTLYVDVDGRCGSSVNGQTILNRLKEDTRDRMQRGHAKPHYLILGYSKGGVDALDAFLLDRDFVHSQVVGLVTIASPLQGTSLIESTDLPLQISRDAVLRSFPTECKEKSAAQSISRAPRSNFWARNMGALAGLTRYYSISFKSEMAEAHPWMKICKVLAKFNTENDGVVSVASSKFPESLRAVDLGTVQADHLAGIQASSFPQEAFLETILETLNEMGAFDRGTTQRWYEKSALTANPLISEYHIRTLSRAAWEAMAASDTRIIDLVGPLPSGSADLQQSEVEWDWFLKLAEDETLTMRNLRCMSTSDLNMWTKKFIKSLENTPYALLPFDLSCDGTAVKLRLRTKEVPLWKFWESAAIESIPVTTLRDLLEILLKRGQRSGLNYLEPSSESLLASLPKSDRASLVLPFNTLNWTEDQILELKGLPEWMSRNEVVPFSREAYPAGIPIVFDHSSMKSFRREYQWSYESRSPGAMDDNPAGYFPWLENKTEAAPVPTAEDIVLRMRSKDNSTRLTTAAIRFRVSDFPKTHIRLKVTQGVTGADPAKGGSGKDDSAFQLWFTLRNLKKVKDRTHSSPQDDVKLFGYYWADPNTQGQMPPAGTLVENYYSNKNFLVVTLPTSYELVLEGGVASQGRWFDFRRNLEVDLKRAFPDQDVNDWEVVALTLQTDSDDSHSESECFLKKITFEQ